MKAAETCTYFVTKFKFQTVLEKQHKAADYVHSYKCYMCAGVMAQVPLHL